MSQQWEGQVGAWEAVPSIAGTLIPLHLNPTATTCRFSLATTNDRFMVAVQPLPPKWPSSICSATLQRARSTLVTRTTVETFPASIALNNIASQTSSQAAAPADSARGGAGRLGAGASSSPERSSVMRGSSLSSSRNVMLGTWLHAALRSWAKSWRRRCSTASKMVRRVSCRSSGVMGAARANAAPSGKSSTSCCLARRARCWSARRSFREGFI